LSDILILPLNEIPEGLRNLPVSYCVRWFMLHPFYFKLPLGGIFPQGMRAKSAGSREGQVVGFCELGDEPSGSINKAGFF
jgi:hypothetical protein